MNQALPESPLWNRAPLLAIAVYLLMAGLLGFRNPGLHNDEAVFYDGAVHMLNSGQEPSFTHDAWSWVSIFGRRWPVMVLPYASALRSYLALLPFAVFGPNYYSARIVGAVAGAFGIWGLSVLIASLAGAETAAVAGFILAINPAYLANTIYDQGGVTEWLIPFGFLSIAVAHFLQARSSGSAFWLGAAAGFGVWSRANIAWLLASALLAAVLVLRGRALVPWRHFCALAAGGTIGGAPLLWYEIHSHGATFAFMRSMSNPLPLLNLVGLRLKWLCQSFLADGHHRFMWSGPALPHWQIILFSSVVALALGWCLWAPHGFGRIGALTFVFLLACMLVSRLNVSDHHLITLVPIAAALVAIAARDISHRWSRARFPAALIAIFYIILALAWNLTAARQIRLTGGRDLWSNAIDAVCSHLQRNYPGRAIKAIDWGFQHNLFVLSNAKVTPAELFWGATVERSASGKLWIDEISPGDVYVLHPPALELYPRAAEGFRRAVAASSLPFRRTEFRQNDGTSYAEVLEIVTATR